MLHIEIHPLEFVGILRCNRIKLPYKYKIIARKELSKQTQILATSGTGVPYLFYPLQSFINMSKCLGEIIYIVASPSCFAISQITFLKLRYYFNPSDLLWPQVYGLLSSLMTFSAYVTYTL